MASRFVKIAQHATSCGLCPARIRRGDRLMKHYESGEWAHAKCVIKATYGVSGEASTN